MANAKISQLTSLTGANTASDDLLPIVDTSVNQTKKITVTEFQQAPVSSGAAFSIVYLNGTKVQATSAGFQFDGTNFYLTGNQYYSNNKTAYYRDSTNTPQAVITYGSDDALYFGQGTTNTRNVYYQGSQHIFYSGASEAVRVSSGNLVVATAAKGVNFTANTPAAGMTSQLLNWYEEGTWTPVVSASSGTITSYTASGKYTRIGRSVVLSFKITITTNGTGSGTLFVDGVPYNAAATSSDGGAGRENANTGYGFVMAFGTTSRLYVNKADASYPGANGDILAGTITYTV